MQTTQVSIGQIEAKPREGLTDGGHVYLSCSNCHAGLMDFWVTRPNEIDPATRKVVEWVVQCNCPFCGDESFQKTVKGGFHPAGYATPKPDNEEDVVASTIWVSSTPKNGVFYFEIMKANKDAKPVRAG